MQVSEVMSKPAIVVPPQATVAEVAKTMIDRGVRAIAVVNEANNLLGIVTETDLLMRNARLHFPSYLGILDNLLPVGGDRNLDEEVRKVLAVTAREIMTPDVFTAAPEDDLGEVARHMVQHHLHAVPVLKDYRVEGMLFPSDVVKLVALDTAT